MQETKKKKLMPFIALHVLVFLYSLGGICSKTAASKEFLSFEWILLYGGLLFILAIYAVAWQQIIKWMPLNTAYTGKSVGVIWTMMWGVLIFHEQLTVYNIISAALIIAGVVLMTTSGEKKTEGDEESE